MSLYKIAISVIKAHRSLFPLFDVDFYAKAIILFKATKMTKKVGKVKPHSSSPVLPALCLSQTYFMPQLLDKHANNKHTLI